VFCGWLCPFGALQDLAYRLGRWLKLPALRLPFVVHERLAALKYVFFLVIFALSLNFTEQALAMAEIEPFKTAVSLKFMRPWPFVLYALSLLAFGLVLERMFCRYLCPLGAGLAIPARLRLFEWLKRKKQCGTECQICASRCPVQAIHPDGRINPNECIYCLNCQLLYHDASTCPPLIARRQRREARGGVKATPAPVAAP
jgi:polyferredoxin